MNLLSHFVRLIIYNNLAYKTCKPNDNLVLIKETMRRTNKKTTFIKESNGNFADGCEATTTYPCVFPFKYNDKSYNTCIKGGFDFFWCATSVDWSNLYWQKWGKCTEPCPTEDTSIGQSKDDTRIHDRYQDCHVKYEL